MALPGVGGQRAEEVIDGHSPAPSLGGRREAQQPVLDGQVLVRGDHVDVAGPRAHAVFDLRDGQGAAAREHVDHQALVIGVEVLDDHVGGGDLGIGVGEQDAERVEAAGRGPDADDREGGLRVLGGGGLVGAARLTLARFGVVRPDVVRLDVVRLTLIRCSVRLYRVQN
jgi:hypothetical protein